ncbi:hypothetical protein JTB14_035437 [Gonioctena quinquepunctata]|nr:hypothetical protein JTB14_035437 [Gonioctena quinquepunctata]
MPPYPEKVHPVYLTAENATIEKLQTAETTPLMTITKLRHFRNPLHNSSSKLLHNTTGIAPIEQRLHILTGKFAHRKHNQEIPNQFCMNRNQEKRVHRKYPVNTIWELIQNMNK